MKWSKTITHVAGIRIQVHATFLILLAWIALASGTVGAAIAGIAFILALFACVALHELGHALAARRYGIRTRDITLLPIGGVARLERMPEDPKQEIVVAVAGPAVNVAIAGVLGAWLWLTAGVAVLAPVAAFLEQLLAINLVLVVFNMIPAFPLDGGRVLRALLALRMERPRATTLAARIGQGFAVALGILGLYVNPFLLLIAVFVWFGASQEAQFDRFRGLLGDARVGDAMATSFATLDAQASVGHAARLSLSGIQAEFPVVLNGTLIGLLRRQDLLRALEVGSPDTPVHRLMQRTVVTAEREEKLSDVFARFVSAQADAIPVLWRGELVGLLTRDKLTEYAQVSHAARHPDDLPSLRQPA
jgi:Zn-dependent protease